MLIYHSKISDLAKDFQKSPFDVVNLIEKSIKEKIGLTVSSGEWKSWATTLNDFVSKINDPRINDYDILLEYHIPWTRGRIDVIIAGKDGNDKKLIVAELKGWSHASVNKSKKINAGTRYEIPSHPSLEAKSYTNDLINLTNINSDLGYKILSSVVMPNYDRDNKYRLIERKIFEYENKDVDFFDKRNISKFVDYIHTNISEQLLPSELDELKILKRKPINPLVAIKDLKDVMLSSSQQLTLDSIVNEISAKKDSVKKTMLLVKGAPGCGKTLVALHLIQRMAEINFNADLILPGSEFRTYLTEQHLDKSFINNIMGIDITHANLERKQWDVVIFDEAHKMAKMGAHAVNQVFKDHIKNSKFVVVLIDDYQLVRKDGATSSEYIAFCEKNEIDYINFELNESFRNGGNVTYPDWVRSWIYDENLIIGDLTFKQTKFNGQDFKFVNHDTEDDFIKNYEDDFKNFHTKMLSMWFLHPNFIPNIEKDGSISKEIKIGNKDFLWNINNEWRERIKGANKFGLINKKIREDFDISFNLKNGKSDEYIGYYHNVQGAEFEKAYVYIPDFIKWDDDKNEIVIDADHYFLDKDMKYALKGNAFAGKTMNKKKLTEKQMIDFNIKLLKNRLYVLLTRATKEMHVYCKDKKLSQYISSNLMR